MYNDVSLYSSDNWILWLYFVISITGVLLFYGIKANQFNFSRIFRFIIFLLVLFCAFGQYQLFKYGFYELYLWLGAIPADNGYARISAIIFFLLYCCFIPDFRLKKNIKNPISG